MKWRSSGRMTSAPAARAAAAMPLRSKQTRGSLQLMSVTMTWPAPASQAQLHDRGDERRVRVGGLLGRAVPADVRLDDDDVAAGDEAADAAEFVDGPAHQRVRRAALDDDHLGQRGVVRNAGAAVGHEHRRLRGPLASGVQPRAGAERGGAEAAEAEHAQHELAAIARWCRSTSASGEVRGPAPPKPLLW